VTLARSTLYFHRVPCLERPRDKYVGSAIYDSPSVQFCPFLKLSVLANAAAPQRRSHVTFLVAATAASLYFLLVVIISIIRSLLIFCINCKQLFY